MLIESKGFMRAEDLTDCEACRSSRVNRWIGLGPYRDWYDGYTVKEKHASAPTAGQTKHPLGLRLSCFYGAYMQLLGLAKEAYAAGTDITKSRLAHEGRAALVAVEPKNVLAVDEPNGVLVMRASRFYVLDLVDQLPLVPVYPFLLEILEANTARRRRLHFALDAMRFSTWCNFPKAVSLAFGAAG